jgi:hypothetical protein
MRKLAAGTIVSNPKPILHHLKFLENYGAGRLSRLAASKEPQEVVLDEDNIFVILNPNFGL